MKLMLSTNNIPVVDFDIDLDKKIISNINILKPNMARIYFEGNTILTYDVFESLLQKYMGGKDDLKKYLNHIKKYGFYTPYKPNLRIKMFYNIDELE